MTAAAIAPNASVGLSERAMNVTLHLSMWGGKRIDKKVTQDVLTERHAAPDAGRFEKYLVPPKDLQGPAQARTRARARHYAMTLPWGDEGIRIIPSTIFFDYSNAMNEEHSNCDHADTEFFERYPAIVSGAAARMGPTLFNQAEYPTLDTIKSKFGFQMVLMPVPDKDDFRVTVGRDVEERIRRHIELTVGKRFADAQRDLYGRLLDTVRHFAVTMRKEDKVFRDTTVTKLADIARMAPKLALAPDPELELLCEEIVRLTNGLTAQDLRNNNVLRKETAKSAEDALAKLQNAMAGAF